jgi:hypothetical protein
MADTPNKEDEELLKLAGEFKEYMLSRNTSFPDISGKDIWDKLYYAGMLPGILRFFMARENHFEVFLKVVGGEDELENILNRTDYKGDVLMMSTYYAETKEFGWTPLIDVLKSRDQRIVLEAQAIAFVWAVGIIDKTHFSSTGDDDDNDPTFKGIKSALRGQYKEATGIDPALNYPISATLKQSQKEE